MAEFDPIRGDPTGSFKEVSKPSSTPEVSPKDTTVSEPAEEVVEEKASSEATPVEEKVEEPGNWWDPKNWKDDNHRKAVQTEFQKTKAEAKRAKDLEAEAITYKQQIQQITEDVRKAIADPEVYRQYRRQLGYETEIPQEVKTPELKLDNVTDMQGLQTAISNHVGEVNKYWENKLQTELAKAQARFEAKVSSVAEPVAQEKWNTAMSKMEQKFGPSFSERKQEIVNKIVNGAYRTMYGQTIDGKKVDEASLLEKVFIAEFPEEYYSSRKAMEKASVQSKVPAATARPSKKSASTVPTDNSKEAIIARIRNKFGS